MQGFLYTLNKVTTDGTHSWVCEKRVTCKARLITTQNGTVLIPTELSEIIASHSHAPNLSRAEMLRNYQCMNLRATDSGEKKRTIVSQGMVGLSESSIASLPRLESVKRTIRRQKVSMKIVLSIKSAACVLIPDRYMRTLKDETFLIFDSGIGDTNRMHMFSTPKMLSLLQESQSWFAEGTLKVVPEPLFQLSTIHAEKDSISTPCVYTLLTNKTELVYRKLLMKLRELQSGLNPLLIVIDF